MQTAMATERDSVIGYVQESTGVPLTEENIEAFLEERRSKGLLDVTVEKYRKVLERLYQALPEEKQIKAGTLAWWQQDLLDSGISPASANVFLSVCNSFLDYMGHREYQLAHRLMPQEKKPPELTRQEYLRLLQTAKLLGKERTYLLVKVFGSTNLHIQDLSSLTVESVQNGIVEISQGQTIRIPGVLAEELLAYASRNGIRSGAIFINRNGTPLNRSSIAIEIQRLGEEAHIPEGKANAKALNKLWQEVRAGIVADMELFIDQAMNLKLEQEQISVGWKA